jgi:Fe2+-dicitrate sensor, membrane component
MNDVEQLIIDKLTGQIGDEDESRLKQLIARHHEVEQLWQQMQQVYAMRNAVSFENSFDADAAWQRLQQRVELQTTPATAAPEAEAVQPKSGSVRWMRVAMAAAVTGIILVSVYLFTDWFRQGTPGPKSVSIQLANGQTLHPDSGNKWLSRAQQWNISPGAMNTITVPAGKTFNLQLADGTEMWLNAESELRFPLSFTGVQRELQLMGEAYFKVAHKPEQPFVVKVNGISVKALGTEFNVRSYERETGLIALVTGSVMVQNEKGLQVTLEPGEAVVADNSSNTLNKEKFDEQTALAWMKGLYYFRNEKLHDITIIARRWFDVPVILKDSGLADIRFTGALNRNKPVDNFLDLLTSTGYIRYEWKKGKIIISRN